MTNKSFDQLVLESNSIPWNRNWEADSQPGYFSTFTYMEIARKLRVDALKSVKNMLEHIPSGVIKDDHPTQPRYYTLEPRLFHGVRTTSIDDLIAELQENDDKIGQKVRYRREMDAARASNDTTAMARIARDAGPLIDVEVDPRFLKSAKRIATKLKEYQVQNIDHPEKIGDYLRMQILFDNAHDLAHARHSIQFGNELTLTSQKDKLRRPDERGGHRSYMAHAEISNDHFSLKFEIMLALYQAETFLVDKTFRNSERTSLEMASKYSAEKASLSTAYFAASQALEQLRKISFYNLYSEIKDMNAMLDPDIDVTGICQNAERVAEFNAVSCSAILGKLPTVARLYPNLVEPHVH